MAYVIVILEVLDFLELLDKLSYRMTSFAAAQRMKTAEPPEPCRFHGAKSQKLKAESKCTTNN